MRYRIDSKTLGIDEMSEIGRFGLDMEVEEREEESRECDWMDEANLF